MAPCMHFLGFDGWRHWRLFLSGLRWHRLLLTALLFRFANGWLCCIRGFSFLVHDNLLYGKLVNFGDVSFFGLVPRGILRRCLRK